jgi:hypothetical protein
VEGHCPFGMRRLSFASRAYFEILFCIFLHSWKGQRVWVSVDKKQKSIWVHSTAEARRKKIKRGGLATKRSSRA